MLPIHTWIWDHSLKHGKATSDHSIDIELFMLPISYQFPGTTQKRVGPGSHVFHLVRILVDLILCGSWAGNCNRYVYISAIAMPCCKDNNAQHSSLASGSYVPSVSSYPMFPELGGWPDKMSHVGWSIRFLILIILTSSASPHWLLSTAKRSSPDQGWQQSSSKVKAWIFRKFLIKHKL